eukprot:SAG11_NODE_3466_length_2431_cov_1.517153_1_plen_84_part_10
METKSTSPPRSRSKSIDLDLDLNVDLSIQDPVNVDLSIQDPGSIDLVGSYQDPRLLITSSQTISLDFPPAYSSCHRDLLHPAAV